MSVTTTNNIMDVFVNADVAQSTWANTTTDMLATLSTGEIGVVGFYAASNKEEILGASAGGTVTAAKYPYIRFVKKTQSGELLYGSKIYGKDLVFAKSTAAVLVSEQAYFIGYNTSSGSLDVSQANEFILTIAYDHDDMMWSEQKLRNSYDYYSAAPTQAGLAFSMASQINYKESLGALNGTGRMVRAEVTSNGSSGTTTTGFTVTQDSSTITKTTHGLTPAAGDLIKVGSFYYTVVSYTANNIVLNMNYQGASGTASVITGQTPTAYGIKISGQPLTWKKDFFKFNKVKFHFDLKGFGATGYDRPGSISANSSESSKGKGFWQEVSELESFSAGFQGALNRMVVPLPIGLNEVPATTPSFSGASSGYEAYYNMWYLESRDTNNASPIVGTAPMRIQTFCFFPDGTNGDATQTQLNNAAKYGLAAWVASTGASGSISTVSAV